MKKLQEINRLVEEAITRLEIVKPQTKEILTSLARKCAEINKEDYHDCYNTPGNTINNYNARLDYGQVEEVKKEEKPALQPLPEEVPEWFMPTGRDYRVDTWKKVIQHFGTPPREWWMDLKKGDKFVYNDGVDGEVRTFRGIIYLAVEKDIICNLSNCSPYTDPAQSFRSKLTPEMQVEFDKVIETITNTPQP